jgi:hypothetical protein
MGRQTVVSVRFELNLYDCNIHCGLHRVNVKNIFHQMCASVYLIGMLGITRNDFNLDTVYIYIYSFNICGKYYLILNDIEFSFAEFVRGSHR